MLNATTAAELKSNIGPDLTLLDGYDAAYLDTEAIEAAGIAAMHCPGCRCFERISRPTGIVRTVVHYRGERKARVIERVRGIQI